MSYFKTKSQPVSDWESSEVILGFQAQYLSHFSTMLKKKNGKTSLFKGLKKEQYLHQAFVFHAGIDGESSHWNFADILGQYFSWLMAKGPNKNKKDFF